MQLAELASRLGVDVTSPLQKFDDGSRESVLCRSAAERLRRQPIPELPTLSLPTDVGARVVTVSPDVSSSTNLAGWVNKVGVWAHSVRDDWFSDDNETILHWQEKPSGQHVELGIAETNMVGLLAELGATWSRWGQPMLPIGVMYDPFVERALESWSFGIYAGGQSILVGTPSGVPLLEISTDKVDTEIPSPASGVLSIKVPEDQTVGVGTELGSMSSRLA